MLTESVWVGLAPPGTQSAFGLGVPGSVGAPGAAGPAHGPFRSVFLMLYVLSSSSSQRKPFWIGIPRSSTTVTVTCAAAGRASAEPSKPTTTNHRRLNLLLPTS